MMIEVATPCRLHFGLLAYNPAEARQFGGVGLMVQRPRIRVRVRPADDFTAAGPMADRAVTFARRFAAESPAPIGGVHVDVLEAPRAHTGLGTGTQLGMAVARGMAELIDADGLGVDELARLVKRGVRSAIGAHGFFHGGLIIEGGKRDRQTLSPMLVQQPFPQDWPLVLISPARLVGINGVFEKEAFATLDPIPTAVTAELCRLVMFGLLPAVIERDVESFGEALYELQMRVGECFKAAQGGIYADPQLEDIVRFVRDRGVRGVGQSSWGPTLYAVAPDPGTAQMLVRDLCKTFDLSAGEVFVTEADNSGCTVETQTAPAPRKQRSS